MIRPDLKRYPDHERGDVWCARCTALEVAGTDFPLRHTAALLIGGTTFNGAVGFGGVEVTPCAGFIHVDAVQTPPYKPVTLALTCDGCDFNQKVGTRGEMVYETSDAY